MPRISASLFDDALRNSDFCFILPGDTPSTSILYKAVFAGCIPVIFVAFPEQSEQLPFYLLLNYSSFSIVVCKDVVFSDEAISSLLAQLNTINQDKVLFCAMKHALGRIALAFDYTRKVFPSPYHLFLVQLEVSQTLATRRRECHSSPEQFITPIGTKRGYVDIC